jgi:hypothetical protein
MTATLALPATAVASPFDPSGVIHVVKPQLNASQSSNWFGYDAGVIERGGTLFNSVSADWTVPSVAQHAAGTAGDSATWIGIGGACLDPSCALTDATLIQAGTEQDVDSSGRPSYSAWWELVPAPAVTIGNVSVAPGDRIHVTIGEAVPNSEVWTVTLNDVTDGQSFSTTVPYTSTHSTAEWIEETPLTFGSDGVGEASLPNLSETQFTNATVNGAPAHLTSGEEIQLIDSSGSVIGTPSAPFGGGTGFADCAWAKQCAVPSIAGPVARSGSAPRHKHRRHRHHRHRRRHHRHHLRHRHGR